MIDRELYLPRCWTDDPDRLAEAGVPAGIEFATKPALATGMLTCAPRAGVSARWVTADEVYGADPGLRAECELAGLGYVLAIGCDRRIPTAAAWDRARRPAVSLSVTLRAAPAPPAGASRFRGRRSRQPEPGSEQMAAEPQPEPEPGTRS